MAVVRLRYAALLKTRSCTAPIRRLMSHNVLLLKEEYKGREDEEEDVSKFVAVVRLPCAALLKNLSYTAPTRRLMSHKLPLLKEK